MADRNFYSGMGGFGYVRESGHGDISGYEQDTWEMLLGQRGANDNDIRMAGDTDNEYERLSMGADSDSEECLSGRGESDLRDGIIS